MKKILFFLALVFFVLVPSNNVFASSVSLSSDTLSTLGSANEQMFVNGFSSQGLFPNGSYESSTLVNMMNSVTNSPALTGFNLFNIRNEDYTVRTLTQSEIDTFKLVYPRLLTQDGMTVEWEDAYYVTYDNGYFHGSLYVDGSGNILTANDNTLGNTLLYQLGFGGLLRDNTEWANIYSDLAVALDEAELTYSDSDGFLSSGVSFYYSVGASKYRDNQKLAQSLYIPNMYSSDIYFDKSSPNDKNSYRFIYFVNDPSEYITTLFSSNVTDLVLFKITQVDWPVNGITYNYRLENIYYDMYYNYPTYIDTYDSFLNFQYSGNDRANHNWQFANNEWRIANISSSDTVSFNYYDDSLIDVDENYSWDEMQNLKDKLDNTNWTLNDSFSATNKINSNNFPYNPSQSISESIPSTLPFPGTATGEDDPAIPDDPALADDPALIYDPAIEQTNENILNSFSNLQIPFLSGLQNRFPFCIPWDIRDAISLLQFSPEPPSWDFNWDITVLGNTYRYHCVGDLSDFNELAVIFRRLMLLAVVIGLAFWSYKMFF